MLVPLILAQLHFFSVSAHADTCFDVMKPLFYSKIRNDADSGYFAKRVCEARNVRDAIEARQGALAQYEPLLKTYETNVASIKSMRELISRFQALQIEWASTLSKCNKSPAFCIGPYEDLSDKTLTTLSQGRELLTQVSDNVPFKTMFSAFTDSFTALVHAVTTERDHLDRQDGIKVFSPDPRIDDIQRKYLNEN